MYACIEDKIINDKTISGKIDFDIKKEKIASKMYYNCIGKICCNIKMLFPQITFTQDMMKDVRYNGILIEGLCSTLTIRRDWFRSAGYINTHITLTMGNSDELDYNWLIPINNLQDIICYIIHRMAYYGNSFINKKIMRRIIQKKFETIPDFNG